ncbi:MAG: iron-sulfur cluster assembly scaffold protein [Patescibacteria group bacterium]|jgi:nitrogen fixation NifU-like protein
MSDLYRDIIIDHYKHPRNVGELADAKIHGHEDNLMCGDSVDIYISFNDHGVASDIKWTGEGCALSQASASLLSDMLRGKTREEIAQISEHDILEVVGTSLNPSRQACATLSVHALHKGLKANI